MQESSRHHSEEQAMIEVVKDLPGNAIGFICHGHVTANDYKTTLVPHVEKALRENDKVRLYYETAADFTGIDPAAMWEDTKVGFGHFSRWERIAVVTDVEWIRHMVGLFGFVFAGQLRVFPSTQAQPARDWIVAN
jgi:hypothetical protein